MSALGDRLRAKRNINPDKVDENELEAVDNAIERVDATLIGVADRFPTRDSMPLIDFICMAVEALAEHTPPAVARAQLKRFADGEIDFIRLGGNTEQLEAELAEERRQRVAAEQSLKAMQNAANSTGPKGLGAGSSPAIMEEIEKYVQKDPERAKGVFDLLQSLSGLQEADYTARALLMSRIVNGANGWELIHDPESGEKLPAVLVSARQNEARLTTDVERLQQQLEPMTVGSVANRLLMAEQELANERNATKADSLAGKLAQATRELDPSINNSAGCKAAWYDQNTDPDYTGGWAYRLRETEAQLVKVQDPTEVGSLAHQLTDITQRLTDVTNELNDERDETKDGSLAHQLNEIEEMLNNERNKSLSGSLAHSLDQALTELTKERDDTVSTSLAGRLSQAKTDLTTTKNELTKVTKERDDAVNVRTPMEDAFNGAAVDLDKALANLDDKHWVIKKLVPKHVDAARTQITAAMQTLRDAQNTTKHTP